jgi:hypothetical protein
VVIVVKCVTFAPFLPLTPPLRNFTHHIAKQLHTEALACKTTTTTTTTIIIIIIIVVKHRSLWLGFAIGRTRILFPFITVMTCTLVSLNIQE